MVGEYRPEGKAEDEPSLVSLGGDYVGYITYTTRSTHGNKCTKKKACHTPHIIHSYHVHITYKIRNI